MSSLEPTGVTAHDPASLATIPAEVVLNILSNLEAKNDWLGLARTCRRLSNFVVPELDKYSVEDGDYYAVWYACVANKPLILRRQIALDPTVVNRHFTRDFRRRRVRRVKPKWTFHPELSVFGKGITPLAVAAVAGSDDIVRLLLVNGADPNRPDLKAIAWRPIHWAVASKHESSVAIIEMLGAHSVNMNQRAGIGAPIFSLLKLQKPQWDSRNKRQTNCEEFNDDLRQLQSLRLRQLEALLRYGADPNIRYDWDLVTPVFFLLSHLATYKPSFYFEKSLTLSHEENEQANVVNNIATSFLDTLRNFGADIYKLGNVYFSCDTPARRMAAAYPETPLHVACRLPDRYKPVTYWFLRNGLSINSPCRAQSTPLIAYCDSMFTNLELFQYFLRTGPLINQSDILGRTVLHHLCANRGLRPQVMEKAVKMLLDKGADPTIVSNEGYLPAEELNIGNPNSRKLESPYKDVLSMLEMATKAWDKRVRKQEEQKSKDNERLPLTCSNRADNRRSDRERQVNRGSDERKNGNGNKKTNYGTGSSARSRKSNHTTGQGRNRENQEEKSIQNRYSHQDTSHGGIQQSNGDNSNSEAKDTSRKPHVKDAPLGNDQSAPRGTFHSKVRGGRYGGNNRGGHRGGHRGNRGTNGGVNQAKPEQVPISSPLRKSTTAQG